MMSDEDTNKANATDDASPLDWVYTDAGKRKLWMILGSMCAVSYALEMIYWLFHIEDRHEGDLFPGAFAVVGFGCCTGMIYLAKWLGKFLKVRPDYYEEEEDVSNG